MRSFQVQAAHVGFKRIPHVFGLMAALLYFPGMVAAQSYDAYPERPVRMVVGYTPGGSTDTMARQVATGLSKLWGQPVIIENKPGAGANIGADFVAKSAPDGYTLLMWHDGLAANASLYENLPYDPIKDLAPVSTVARASIVMGVGAAVPAKSVQDVINMAKEKPGQLSYASCGVGTSHHIAGEMFKSEADVDIQHIAYKGCSPALSDVLGGHIPIFFQTISNITQQMETDKIRVLAVLDPERLQAYPDLPTMSETPGMADFTVTPWYGIFAPGGTPGKLLEKISADIEKVMATPELQESFAQKYYRVETISPREFSDLVKTDIDRLGKVIKNAGMSAN